jgi:hypothetical protein
MERVAEARGVLFINDSKATNPASTAPALAAFPRIHWIVGGLPKGDDLDECAPFFDHVVAAYTIGEAGPRFAEILEPVMPVSRSEMLCDAVSQAIAAARPGDVVMLSPACASFDQFRDFEARGDAFRQIVEALTGGPGKGERPAMNTTPTRLVTTTTREGGVRLVGAAHRFRRTRRSELLIWWREIDRVLLGLILTLLTVGAVAVAAASPASAHRLSTAQKSLGDLYFFWIHLRWLAVGLTVMFIASLLPANRRGGWRSCCAGRWCWRSCWFHWSAAR